MVWSEIGWRNTRRGRGERCPEGLRAWRTMRRKRKRRKATMSALRKYLLLSSKFERRSNQIVPLPYSSPSPPNNLNHVPLINSNLVHPPPAPYPAAKIKIRIKCNPPLLPTIDNRIDPLGYQIQLLRCLVSLDQLSRGVKRLKGR